MGLMPPPKIQPPDRFEPLDIEDATHQLAWSRFEAQREFAMGSGYAPYPKDELIVRVSGNRYTVEPRK